MDEIILLNRVRVDIGNVSGSLSELMQYATLKGFNDNYEPLEKPRLVGTWTVNNYCTSAQLSSARASFDGLTIICSEDWLINFNDIAVQVLDNTLPNYNPALSIILQKNNLGNLLEYPCFDGLEGRWFLLKSLAAAITSFGSMFCNQSTVLDTNYIVSSSAQSYDFEYFNEILYFTGVTLYGLLGQGDALGGFYGCRKLKEFDIPTWVTSGYRIFQHCNSLTRVSIPQNLTNLGYYTFERCNNLLIVEADKTADQWLNFDFGLNSAPFIHSSAANRRLILNDYTVSKTTIPNYAFYNCSNITNTSLPPSAVTTVGTSAYAGTSISGNLSLPNCVSIGSGAFSRTGITSVTLSNATTSIGALAFQGCSLLTSINLQDTSITSVTYSFLGTSILELIFPATLTRIEDHVFSWYHGGSINLSVLDFSRCINLSYIGPYTFESVPGNLSYIRITPEAPFTIDSNAFFNTSFNIYLGNGNASHDESIIDAYSVASNWSTLYNAGRLLPWYLHEHTPALQSYDSSAPNYYPALCICFEQAGYGRYVTTNNKTKGWYMSDEEAASITDTGNVLKNKSIITDVNGICGTVGATYTLRSADLSSFTNIESIDLSGSTKMSNVTIAQNSPLSKYKLPTVEDCDWRNSDGWIQGNASPFINTGIFLSNPRIEFKFEYQNPTEETYPVFFRQGVLNSTSQFNCFYNNAGYKFTIRIGTSDNTNIATFTSGSIYEVDVNLSRCVVNGTSTNISGSFNTSNPDNLSIVNNLSKFYYFKIYDGDTLVREMYPAVDFNGIYCMYDYVTELFFYNQGTGSFTVSDKVIAKGKGIPVNSSSNAYWRYSGGYIKSSGTQYINSNLIPQSGFSMELKFKLINTSQTTYFGARTGNLNKSLWIWFNTRANIQLGSTNYDGRSPQLSANTEYVLALKSDGFYLNGTRFVNDVALTFTLDYPLYLFGGNNGGNPTTDNSMEIYYCKLYQSNTLVRDMYPAIDSNGVVCMYDYVSNLYFYNQGTGNFTASQEVIDGRITPFQLFLEELPRLRASRDWRNSGGYIRSSGTQWIDTGITANYTDLYVEVKGICRDTGPGVIMATGISGDGTSGYFFGWYGTYTGINNFRVSGSKDVHTHFIDGVNKQIGIDSSIISGSPSSYNPSPSNLRLFSYTMPNEAARLSNSDVYYLIIKRNGVLIREMYPAIDDNGVACMYDYVSDQFFYNQGTGDLIVSDEVVNTPYLNIGVPSKIQSLTFLNCPNIDSIKLLSKIASAQDTLLNTVNATIPNTTGSIEDLISITALWNNQSGENSNLKISGNYAVNDASITIAQCNAIGYNPDGATTQMSSKIYGLMITIDPGSIIVLQSYDSTDTTTYNPAMCILFKNEGSLIDDNDPTLGWYMTKALAGVRTNFGRFSYYAINTVTDTDGICGTVGATYDFSELWGNIFYNIISTGAYNFRACTKIKTIIIGENLTTIEAGFCENVTNITFISYAVTPPTTAYGTLRPTFQHIYVPFESVDMYKSAAFWSDYASIIEAIPSN